MPMNATSAASPRSTPPTAKPRELRYRKGGPWPQATSRTRPPRRINAAQRRTQGDGESNSCDCEDMASIISRRSRWRPHRVLCNTRRGFLPGGATMAPNTRAISFPGESGAPLSARLDAPAEPPLAYALFAHCFTCSKDSKAATYVSAALAERGIAVLRFDFTGLGGSEGDFANTNFSSNVGDLGRASCRERV